MDVLIRYFAPRRANGNLNVALLIVNLVHLMLGVALVALAGVAVALSRSMYRRTLHMLALRLNKSAKHVRGKDKLFLSSMQAEEHVETILREEGWRHVFLRRRVAVARVGHNREIDVIAVGPVILVVEVKHWQGNVWCNGPRWFQQPSPGQRRTLEFEDVREDNVVKAAALRRYIENTCRIPLPDLDAVVDARDGGGGDGKASSTEPARQTKNSRGTWYLDNAMHKQCGECVVPVVVFTNPRVRLDPATVQMQPNVFTLQSFRTFVHDVRRGGEGTRGAAAVATSSRAALARPCNKFLRWIVRHCTYDWRAWWRRRLPWLRCNGYAWLDATTQSRAAHAIDMLRTWDLVYMHDGRLITGDVQRIEAPSASCSYERKHLLDIRLNWNTGTVGLLQTFLLNRAANVELVLVAAKRLQRRVKEKTRRNAQGNVVFSLSSRRAGRAVGDHLVVKPAGTVKLMNVELIDIRRVVLSHHLNEIEETMAS